MELKQISISQFFAAAGHEWWHFKLYASSRYSECCATAWGFRDCHFFDRVVYILLSAPSRTLDARSVIDLGLAVLGEGDDHNIPPRTSPSQEMLDVAGFGAVRTSVVRSVCGSVVPVNYHLVRADAVCIANGIMRLRRDPKKSKSTAATATKLVTCGVGYDAVATVDEVLSNSRGSGYTFDECATTAAAASPHRAAAIARSSTTAFERGHGWRAPRSPS